MNRGGVVKFDLAGNALDTLWDAKGAKHPSVSSVREHKGYLYLLGIYNNRIGRYKLDAADPAFNDRNLYWGKKA